jgi:geranylgeranyl diphosphate synthase type II
VHSDEKNEKITYVAIMDLEKANNEVRLISTRAMDSYEALSYKNQFLKDLIKMLINREK